MMQFKMWWYSDDLVPVQNFLMFLGYLDVINYEIHTPLKPDDDQVKITIWGISEQV